MSSAARIEELQKKFDENPRRYFAPLANECRKAGELDAAIAICRAHLPQQPGHMSGHIVYGQALFEAGELDEAQTVFQTALGLDPENLIALRHLGDICARHGDHVAARQWYTRVLDADPRNEEIQSLLASSPVDGSPVPAAPALELDDTASVTDRAELPGDGEGETGAPSGPEGELPELLDPELLAAAAESESAPESGSPPEARGLDTPGEPAHVVESFTLDGLEPTSFEPTGVEPTSFELTSVEPTSVEPTSVESPATDDVPPPSLERPAAADLHAGGDAAFEPIDLEPPEADGGSLATSGTPPGHGNAFVTETMAELYLRQGYRDRAIEVYRQLVILNPGDEGLRDRMAALEAEDNSAADEGAVSGMDPSGATPEPTRGDTGTSPEAGLPAEIDPELLEAAAEADEAGSPAGSAEGAPPAPAPRRGPTIREFLGAVAAGRPLSPQREDDPGPGAGADDVELPRVGGEVAEVVALPSPIDSAAPAEAGVQRGTEPAARLDTVFPEPPTAADEAAAERLAAAFDGSAARPQQEDGAPDPLRGRPARPAGNDLSLDHVFGQQRRNDPGRQTGSFSFDQFFAEGAVRGEHEAAPGPEAAGDSDDDIAQFNSWLKGLKPQ